MAKRSVGWNEKKSNQVIKAFLARAKKRENEDTIIAISGKEARGMSTLPTQIKEIHTKKVPCRVRFRTKDHHYTYFRATKIVKNKEPRTRFPCPKCNNKTKKAGEIIVKGQKTSRNIKVRYCKVCGWRGT